MDKRERLKIEKIARKNGVHHIDGTSVLIIDHDKIRDNYKRFTKAMPRVQAYYAVKANALPEIVETIFKLGGSFDVASYPEFLMVHRQIKNMSHEKKQEFIWEKIVYAHPVKTEGTLQKLNKYRPLVTYDSMAEIEKIQKYAPHSGLLLRLWSPNEGSVVDLSCKFGAPKENAIDLIRAALYAGLTVEGLSFHAGSQCQNFSNYTKALEIAHEIFDYASRSNIPIGHKKREGARVLDIGGGFPVKYEGQRDTFDDLADLINRETDKLFPANQGFELIAEPGRFMVANAATLVARITGVREHGPEIAYFINDGLYHTFSGQLFDHIPYPLHAFKKGPESVCKIFGQTCDGFDVVSSSGSLPIMKIGDLVYAEDIGAYSNASSTLFNGFKGAKIVHINK
jgi:ornithine decarboxylase